MSTKKNIVSPTKEKKPLNDLNEETCKRIAKQVAKDHAGQPKPQLLHKVSKETDPTKILFPELKGKRDSIKKVLVVCWLPDHDKKFMWVRTPVEVNVIVDFTDLDRVPTLADVKREIAINHHEWNQKGWYLSEEDAYFALLKDIERELGHITIEQEYGQICPNCMKDVTGYLFNTLRNAREWFEDLADLRAQVDGDYPVIPDLDEFEIKDRKFVPIKEHHCKCGCGGKCHCKKGKK